MVPAGGLLRASRAAVNGIAPTTGEDTNESPLPPSHAVSGGEQTISGGSLFQNLSLFKRKNSPKEERDAGR